MEQLPLKEIQKLAEWFLLDGQEDTHVEMDIGTPSITGSH